MRRPKKTYPQVVQHRPLRGSAAMRLIVGADSHELAEEGDEACDFPRPAGCPDDVACPFKKGHRCRCRYFGKLEFGRLGGS